MVEIPVCTTSSYSITGQMLKKRECNYCNLYILDLYSKGYQ